MRKIWLSRTRIDKKKNKQTLVVNTKVANSLPQNNYMNLVSAKTGIVEMGRLVPPGEKMPR